VPRPPLAERLARVRGPAAPDCALHELPAAIAGHLSPSLAERLRRLSRVGSAASPARPLTSPADAPPGHADGAHRLAIALGGSVVAPGLVRVTARLALPLRLGCERIDEGTLRAARLHALGLTRTCGAGDVLFLDTETTGLAGGTGTLAFMVGIARIDRDALSVTQWVLDSFAGEAHLVVALAHELAPHRALASYNGKAFDVPLLRTRFAMCRQPDPFGPLAHADLLHAARRIARWRPCPDLRLASVEAHWLGAPRVDDLPGSAAPAAWRRWLTAGEAVDLAAVLRHNRRDLVALAALTACAGRISAGLFAGAPC